MRNILILLSRIDKEALLSVEKVIYADEVGVASHLEWAIEDIKLHRAMRGEDVDI